MEIKFNIKVLIQSLIGSALERETEQGLIVYRKAFEFIENASNEEKTLEILQKLNKALVNIEAHGYLTNFEYSIVKELRCIYESNKQSGQ